MLTAYIAAAMGDAMYTRAPDGAYYGEIPECAGVGGMGSTQEACRADLQDALEVWLVSGLRHNDSLPILAGQTLTLQLIEDLDTIPA